MALLIIGIILLIQFAFIGVAASTVMKDAKMYDEMKESFENQGMHYPDDVLIPMLIKIKNFCVPAAALCALMAVAGLILIVL